MAAMQWFLARNQKRIGPFSSIQLQQLVSCGFLSRSDLVMAQGATKWVEAETIPGLFPSGDKRKFWVSYKGKTRGPYVLDQLRAGLAAEQWGLDAQVWTDESGQVMRLSDLPEFKDYAPPTVSRSQAQLFTGSLEIEEASLYLAGKQGDELARLMALLMDLKRTHADNASLVESFDKTLEMLRARREEVLAGSK
jgi:hypothetical protein